MKPRDKLGPALEAARALRQRAPEASNDKPMTAERIEHAMVLLAYIMKYHNDPGYAPGLDTLKRALIEHRDPMDEAERILRDHTLDGTGKEIR